MHRIVRLALIVCLGSVLSAQTKISPPALKGTTALDVYANGDRIELLVAEDQAAGQILVHRHSTDGGVSWSAPVSIEPSRGKLVNPGRNTDPQIVATGQRLIAVWTAPGTVSKWGGGNLATAVSADGGRTWRSGPTPNDDRSGDEHAFIDAVADSKGVSHLVWLDARDGKQGLRFSSSRDGGASWAANQSLDAETCECCWNTLATGWDDALLVLYRDIPRDMALARSDNGGAAWRRSGTVGDFQWAIQGCPDVGGALTRGSTKDEVFALVFTGREDKRGLYTLLSTDNGRTFAAPLRVGPDRAWHADLAFSAGVLYAAWDVNAPNGGISWAWSDDRGRSWRDGGVVSTDGRRATHPKLAVSRGRVVALWTERLPSGGLAWQSAPLRTGSTGTPVH